MDALAAGLPIAVAVVLLLTRRVGGQVIAAVTLVVSVVVAVWYFDFPWSRLAVGYRHALGTAVEIAIILAGGCLLNRVLAAAGTYAAVADWLRGTRREIDRTDVVLLIVLGITPFAESVTGFRVGIVMAIPLLRSVGFSPSRAAALGLLGLVIVPWGALAPGTLIAATVTGIPVDRIGQASAWLSLPVFLCCGAAALWVGYGRAALSRLPDLLWSAGALWLGVLAAQYALGTPPAGAVGSVAGIAAGTVLLRLRHGSLARPGPRLAFLLSPYAVLLAGILLGRMIFRLASGHGAAVAVLTSPALWLAVAAGYAVGVVLDRERVSVTRAALAQWWPVASTTLLFLFVGTTLAASGMSGAVAAAAGHLGPAYPLAAPWIGGVGGFLTGSNSGANAMFAAGQAAAAASVHRSALVTVAIQNVSGSLLTMASLPRLTLARQLASAAPATTSASPASPAANRNHDAVDRNHDAADRDRGAVDADHDAVDPDRDAVDPDRDSVSRAVLGADAVVLVLLSVVGVVAS
ncbi:L-lactate permease [Nocardia sp. BMG111209]|uniref:L-lactate permease n=1 Tax=Nocardia sp. BMG111209 TaxID=1160137 RepID=UPI00035D7621|nr:L-lactate permease [Nocardia sp. BMG111209]